MSHQIDSCLILEYKIIIEVSIVKYKLKKSRQNSKYKQNKINRFILVMSRNSSLKKSQFRNHLFSILVVYKKI